MISAVIVFSILTASVCAVLLVFRAENRRIRCLALSIGMLTICQSALMVPARLGWQAFIAPGSEPILQLTSGLLALAVVHFLNRENQDRRGVNAVVRCFELEEPAQTAAPVAAETSRPEPGYAQEAWQSSSVALTQKLMVPTGVENADADVDRRRAPRYRVSSPGMLREESEQLSAQEARVVNISRTGICMVTAKPLSCGDRVEVEIFGRQLRGTVVRSRSVEDGFEHGLKLEPVLRTADVASLLRSGLEAARAALV